MTISPGALKTKDPAASKNGSFDWDPYLGVGVVIATNSIAITGPDSTLTADNVSLAASNRKINYRLLGGTLGGRYQVTCHITTSESPAQTDERSITVLIENL